MNTVLRNRVTLAIVTFCTAVGIGAAWIARSGGDTGHLVGGYATDVSVDTCWEGTTRGLGWVAQGLVIPEGGSGLVLTKVCYRSSEGDLEARLPEGVEWISDGTERPYVPGEAVFEAWVQEHPEAPWRCACGAEGRKPDAGACEQYKPLYSTVPVEESHPLFGTRTYYPRLDGGVWEPVPVGAEWRKIPEGGWRGNCTPIPCVSWGEMGALPAACRVNECRGRVCGPGRAKGECGPEQMVDAEGATSMCVGGQWKKQSQF